jgi:hypothetical protein
MNAKATTITNRLRAHRVDSHSRRLNVISFPKPIDRDANELRAFVDGLHWRGRVHLYALRLLQRLLPDTRSQEDC